MNRESEGLGIALGHEALATSARVEQGRQAPFPRTPRHFFLAAFFSRLTPSAARRFAVRFFAAARDAFSARADRSSAVMFFAAFFPPWLPYACPILRRYSSTSGGIRFAML